MNKIPDQDQLHKPAPDQPDQTEQEMDLSLPVLDGPRISSAEMFRSLGRYLDPEFDPRTVPIPDCEPFQCESQQAWDVLYDYYSSLTNHNFKEKMRGLKMLGLSNEAIWSECKPSKPFEDNPKMKCTWRLNPNP